MKVHTLEFHSDIPKNVDVFKKIEQYAAVNKMNVIKSMQPGVEGMVVDFTSITNPNVYYSFKIWAYDKKDDCIEYEIRTNDENNFNVIKKMFSDM